MMNIEDYFADREKEGKKLVELNCEGYHDYLILGKSEFNFLRFLEEKQYLKNHCEIEIINKIKITEF